DYLLELGHYDAFGFLRIKGDSVSFTNIQVPLILGPRIFGHILNMNPNRFPYPKSPGSIPDKASHHSILYSNEPASQRFDCVPSAKHYEPRSNPVLHSLEHHQRGSTSGAMVSVSDIRYRWHSVASSPRC